jgi:CPA1 family monovalent cation:H+ antiporter
MQLPHIIAILIVLAAAFSYINHRYIGLPASIGLIIMTLTLSFVLEALGALGFAMEGYAARLLGGIDFDQAVLHGMLGFLLFSGALHIDLNELARQKWSVLLLATLGVLLSAGIIGGLLWLILGALDIRLSFLYCLIFGALISPTDPIAVLSILKTVDLPKGLEMQIAGESLFNDGIAVVLFLILARLAAGQANIDVDTISLLVLKEAVGGVACGLAFGAGAILLLRNIDQYPLAILVTLALVSGGYALAEGLRVSAPIAIVIAGLLIGNHGRFFTMTAPIRRHLDIFWELVDETLNAMLFVLIGLEVLVVVYTREHLLASLVAIPIVLLARFGSVGLLLGLLRKVQKFSANAVTILTWGGLRGGVSVALALSLPAGHERALILPITYAVVAFSIIVQGLTVGRLLTRASARRAE